MRIAVIGGGVVGCSVAWHLAARGRGEVTLLERDRLGAGTTWHSAGNITWRPIEESDAPVLYMFDTIDRVERESGLETGWFETGRLFLARSDAAMESYADLARIAAERGHDAPLLDPADAARRHPLLSAAAIAGAWFAYARAAKAHGAKIVEECTVAGIETANGRVAALDTSTGRIAADVAVVCLGLWSRPLLAPFGIALAQGGCRHFYVIARPEPALARQTPSFVCPEDLVYGREEVGGFLYGCFDTDAAAVEPADLPDGFAFSLLDPDWDKFAPYFETAAEIFPALADAPVRDFINGPETFTPDGHPLIGPVGGIEGLHVCTAMNSHGVTLSAAAGHIIADLIAGTDPRSDPAPYAPDRFGGQAADVAWLRQKIAAAPSMSYRQSNM
jgi:glycine/D-amino acid oxidase-like deaminating enzyme